MLKYHVSLPQNQKDTYTSNDNIIFVIPFGADARSLVRNSVRFTGKVKVVGFETNEPVYPLLDNYAGAHTFISRIDTESRLLGSLENMGDYDRFVGSVNRASLHYNDLFASTYSSELMTPDELTSASILAGEIPASQSGSGDEITDTSKASFSFRPRFCLNNMSDNLPLAKTGDLKVEIVLQNDDRVLQQVLKGEEGVEPLTYEISELVLLYNTVPNNPILRNPAEAPVTMRVHSYFKTVVSSSFVNFQTKANLTACDSFFITALPVENENEPLYSNYKCYQIPNVKKLTIEWNDSTTMSQLSYQLIEFMREEILTNFIEGVTNMLVYDNSLTANMTNLSANNSWGMGLKFKSGVVDLTSNKLSINMESDLNTNSPYTLYFFFSGGLTI